MLLAVEHAPTGKRGWYGSWPQMGAPSGSVLANLIFLIVSALPEAQLASWGWRIPFLLSALLVVVGLFVRRAVTETPACTQLKQSRAEARQPVLEVIRRQPRTVLLSAGARMAEAGNVTIFTTFILSYATQVEGLPRPSVVGALLVATIGLIAIVPLAGALSDRLGRVRVYVGGAVFATASALPAAWLIDSRQVGLVMVGLLVGMVGPAIMFGPQASFFAELFGSGCATRDRRLGSSLAPRSPLV